jgi:Uma2 family endonuclease
MDVNSEIAIFRATVLAMNVVLPPLMTVDEFLAWSVRQEKGKYELLDGRVIMQQSQTWGHAELRVRMYNVLSAAIARAGVPFFAAPDGLTVRISSNTAFEPDALVAPLPKPERLDLEIPNPVIVVEVLSPSSAKRDLADKLAGYFRVSSVEHYLVVDPEEREIIWHKRAGQAALEPPMSLREGTLRLDPPGIELALADVFPA